MYTYDANGRRITRVVHFPNLTTRYTHNLAGLVTSVTNTNNQGQILSSYHYTYYLDGNTHQVIETMGSTTRTITYTYDNARRLTREHDTGTGGTNPTTRQYTFDNRGNRTRMEVTGTQNYVVTYTYDINNRLLTETRTGQGAQTSTYTYDRNGNQLTRTTGTQTETKTYNALNQLTNTTTQPGSTSQYTYRADGLRLTTTVNGHRIVHIWSMNNIVIETNANNAVINRYIRTNQGELIRSIAHGWYLMDGRGSVVQRVCHTTRQVLHSYRYSAFGLEVGTTQGTSNNPFRFNAMYFESHSQSYMTPARRMNPRIGRWTSPDPLFHMLNGNLIFGCARSRGPTFREGHPYTNAILQSGNLYLFAMQNPVMFHDPSGLAATAVGGGLYGGYLAIKKIVVPAVTKFFTRRAVVEVGTVAIGVGAVLASDNSSNPPSIFPDLGGSSPGDPDPRRNWQSIKEKYLERALEQQNTDPHQLKRDYLGNKAQISRYDIHIDKGTGQLAIVEKSTGRLMEITNYFI